jgi:hypothetical protein
MTTANGKGDHVTKLCRLGVLCLICTEHPLRTEQHRATDIHYNYIVMAHSIVTEVSSDLRSQLRTRNAQYTPAYETIPKTCLDTTSPPRNLPWIVPFGAVHNMKALADRLLQSVLLPVFTSVIHAISDSEEEMIGEQSSIGRLVQEGWWRMVKPTRKMNNKAEYSLVFGGLFQPMRRQEKLIHQQEYKYRVYTI